MYEKIYKFEEKYWNDTKFFMKCLGIFCLISLAIVILVYYFTNSFYYPENEYAILEKEANRIVETQDYTTEYKCVNPYFDSKTRDLKFLLEDDEKNVISVSVKNYRLQNQETNTYRPNGKRNKYMFFLVYIPFYIIIYCVGISMLVSQLLGIILLIDKIFFL